LNTVRQLLQFKGDQVWTTEKSSTVLDAMQIMSEKHVGGLVVMDNDEVVGIFTERDHARKVGMMNKKPEDVCVYEVMTSDLITVHPSQTVRECMSIMTEKRVRHLPVFEDGEMIGIISIGDVVRDLIEELQFFIQQLENYITGLR
jgi:signal-transduction protein with cAMP-binding, CBS, and nucleotidyltransferase domain